MNNHVTREEAEKLMERLGGYQETFRGMDHYKNWKAGIEEPLGVHVEYIHIGDVLEKNKHRERDPFAQENHDMEYNRIVWK